MDIPPPAPATLLPVDVLAFSSFSKSFRLMTVANFLFLPFFLPGLSFPGEQVKIIFSPVMWMIRGSVVMLPYGVISCSTDKRGREARRQERALSLEQQISVVHERQ